MIIDFNNNHWELTQTVNENSQFVSNGKDVYSVVRTNGLRQSLYYTMALDSNKLSAKPMTLRALIATCPFHARMVSNVSYEHLEAYSLISSNREKREFVNRFKELNDLFLELHNSKNKDEILNILIDNKCYINYDIVSGEKLQNELEKILNQFEATQFIKENMDSLQYLDDMNYNSCALYHRVNGFHLEQITPDEAENLKTDFIKHVFYNRKLL